MSLSLRMVYAQGMEGEPNYDGNCPHCHAEGRWTNDGIVNVGRAHYARCDTHKVAWCIGSNLYSSWREQTEDEQRAIYDGIGMAHYERVEPVFDHGGLAAARSTQHLDEEDLPF